MADDPPPRARETLAPAAPPAPATAPVANPPRSPPEVVARGKPEKARKRKRYRDDDD